MSLLYNFYIDSLLWWENVYFRISNIVRNRIDRYSNSSHFQLMAPAPTRSAENLVLVSNLSQIDNFILITISLVFLSSRPIANAKNIFFLDEFLLSVKSNENSCLLVAPTLICPFSVFNHDLFRDEVYRSPGMDFKDVLG